MSIRTKLLLVSLVLLSIPFVGYGFVREMEKVLRAGQEQAVAATARAVATALHDRPKLLQRQVETTAGDTAVPVRTAGNEIETIIKGLRRSSARIWVIDHHRRLLALEGSLHAKPEEGDRSFLEPFFSLILQPPREDFEDALPEDVLSGGREVYSALSGIPSARWRKTTDERAVILSAAHPIWNGDEVIGAVIAEETTNAVVSLTNRALEKLIAVTLAVFIFGAGTLFLFASSLSRRLSRLRNEAEQAIDAQGRVAQHFQATRDGDEIGDLSRSFGAVLGRLGEYNAYLERMADRLSHELRTPVAVVSSSLENIKSGAPAQDISIYIERAEEGVKRLNRILTRIAEASRLEQILRNAEREPFDLGRVVSGCVAGYAGAFASHRFDLRLAERRVEMLGAPDLIAQALDKLVENAMDFSLPDHPILVTIDRSENEAVLSVSNSGPLLPETMQGRLFESMVSLRSGASATTPHLGLGLFIVRLIAEFHRGRAEALNRPDGSGVLFRMVLPLES